MEMGGKRKEKKKTKKKARTLLHMVVLELAIRKGILATLAISIAMLAQERCWPKRDVFDP